MNKNIIIFHQSLELFFKSLFISGLVFSILSSVRYCSEINPFIIAFSSLLLIFLIQKNIYKKNNLFFSIFIYAFLIYFTNYFFMFESSPDGQTDHYPIIHILSQCSNLSEAYKLTEINLEGGIALANSILGFDFNISQTIMDPYYDLVIKYGYFLQAFIYSFNENVLLIYIIKFLFSLYVFLELLKVIQTRKSLSTFNSKVTMFICIFLLTFIPVVLSQIFTVYSDGVSYQLFLLAIVNIFNQKYISSLFLYALSIAFKTNNIYLTPIYLLIIFFLSNNRVQTFKKLIIFSPLCLILLFPNNDNGSISKFFTANISMITTGIFYGSDDAIQDLNWTDKLNDPGSNIERAIYSKMSMYGNEIKLTRFHSAELFNKQYRILNPDTRYGGGGLMFRIALVLFIIFSLLRPDKKLLFILITILSYFSLVSFAWYDRHFPIYYALLILGIQFIRFDFVKNFLNLSLFFVTLCIIFNIILGNLLHQLTRYELYNMIISNNISVFTTNFWGPIIDLQKLKKTKILKSNNIECSRFVHIPRSETRFCMDHLSDDQKKRIIFLNEQLNKYEVGSI